MKLCVIKYNLLTYRSLHILFFCISIFCYFLYSLFNTFMIHLVTS